MRKQARRLPEGAKIGSGVGSGVGSNTSTCARDYTTGDSEIKIKNIAVTSEKEVTIDFIVSEADSIWRLMKEKNLPVDDMKAREDLMNEMHKSHKEFCTSYPIVNRYICQFQLYDSKVFRRWLDKIKLHPWKGESEYLDATADYITKLTIAKTPRRLTRTEINRFRKQIRQILGDEQEQFKRYAEEFDREVTAELAALEAKNRAQLSEFAQHVGVDGMAPAGTCRVESTVDTDLSDVWSPVDRLLAECVPVEREPGQMCADDLLG